MFYVLSYIFIIFLDQNTYYFQLKISTFARYIIGYIMLSFKIF
jgi:hypothetical protein